MKICQFVYKDAPHEVRVGYILEMPKRLPKVVDINKADPSLPKTLLEILQKDQLQNVKELEKKELQAGTVVPLKSVDLKAPITSMDKILCAELNYCMPYLTNKMGTPHEPAFHSKFPSTVIGPSEYLKIDTGKMKEVDWGVHLAVVMSKPATNVHSSDANKYILGCTVAQDIWARDWTLQVKNAGQLILGRGMDTFCPLGPWIVTLDDLEYPESLTISCSVNGVEKQNSNTCDLVHKVGDMVEHLSSVMTLLPGDIILTGTPPGEGNHYNPPQSLMPGDIITTEIQKIGVLTTKVVNAIECSCTSKTCYNKA